MTCKRVVFISKICLLSFILFWYLYSFLFFLCFTNFRYFYYNYLKFLAIFRNEIMTSDILNFRKGWVRKVVTVSRTTDMGEGNVPPKSVLRLLFSGYVFFFFEKKKLETVFGTGTPFPTDTFILIFVVRCFIPSKMVTIPKIIFRSNFEKYCFFRKSCQMKNIQNFISY